MAHTYPSRFSSTTWECTLQPKGLYGEKYRKATGLLATEVKGGACAKRSVKGYGIMRSGRLKNPLIETHCKHHCCQGPSASMLSLLLFGVILLLSVFMSGCAQGGRSVIVYVSVDQVYSEPILKAFEKSTGVRVRAIYDIEASKTTGLTTRLIAEKAHPRADVFWNGEFVQTLRLNEQGVLAPFTPAADPGLPSAFVDPRGCWFGIGGRARVFLVNRKLMKKDKYPEKLEDFLNPEYPPDKIGMALPLFGTTATHASALFAALGPKKAGDFFAAVKKRGVRIVDGNSTVRNMVAGGQWMFGLTDTDDALGAISSGAPVAVVAPDQDGMGTLVIPGTVALVQGAPHPQEAKELIAYLLRLETEKELIREGFGQWSLHGDLKACPMFPTGLKMMPVSLTEVHRQFPQAMEHMREIFSR
ncbi:MAG: extracellular solute-binding protein [Candidatus Xenobiia bacterium LiM19]